MGGLLVLAGAAGMIIGHILILIAAFRAGILWGIGCLFFPFIGWIFLLTHWEDAKSGFLLEIGGIVLVILGPAIEGGHRRALLREHNLEPVGMLAYEIHVQGERAI